MEIGAPVENAVPIPSFDHPSITAKACEGSLESISHLEPVGTKGNRLSRWIE
jgi:hypothetical protein